MRTDKALVMPTREFPYHAILKGNDVRRLTIPKLSRIVDRDIQHAAVVDYLIAESDEWIISRLDALAVPGIQVDFGFSSNTDISTGGRLPLFASLIADQIKRIAGIQLSSLKLAKRYAEQTTLAIAEAVPARPASAIATATVSTRRSYVTPRFASEIYDVVGDIRAAVGSRDLLCLKLSYITGLPRTWSRLWLPTISGIFSNESAGVAFDDTQIVELELDHVSVGEKLGHGVKISVSVYPPSSAS